MAWVSFGGSTVKRQRVGKTLDLYDKKPEGEISMHEFEQFALDRKRVLSGIESAYSKGLKHEERKATIDKLLGQYLPERNWDEAQLTEDRRKDHVSHSILCFTYSRTRDLQNWLLRQEDRLFKHRFNALSLDLRATVMCELRGADWNPITKEQYEDVKHKLLAVFGGRNMNMLESSYSTANAEYFHKIKEPWTHIYTVPFEDVCALVRDRQVFLEGGKAYVLSRDLDAIASVSFCERLTRKLGRYREEFEEKRHEERERLGPLMVAIPGADVCPPLPAHGQVMLRELPAVLEASAPLCMRSSYSVLQSEHHLKDNGRRQFGLFLKGIGLSMADALLFWRKHFTNVDGERFEKQYAYNIRHQYGQEGKRTNYKPYDCAKVIHAPLDTSGATGCPYRNHGPEKLRTTLAKMGVAADVVKDVLAKRHEGQYKEACTQVFRALHKNSNFKDVVQHPNQYFSESRKCYKEMEGDM